jgi:hypothetical protein
MIKNVREDWYSDLRNQGAGSRLNGVVRTRDISRDPRYQINPSRPP